MKKKVLGIATVCLFTAGNFLSLSQNSDGSFSLVKNAKSETEPQNLKPYLWTCPNSAVIIVCGAGFTSCTPEQCPVN